LSIKKSVQHFTGLLESEGEIGVGVKTEDWWGILGWDEVNFFQELSMLRGFWDTVLVLLVLEHDEDVSWGEDLLLNPEKTVGVEELSVKTISDSSSILDITDHVLHGFPRVRLVEVSTLSHVLLNEGKGSLEI